MLIHSIKLNNFLSFGDSSEAIELGRLNMVIGPNGSGKSNLLESIELIKGAPRDLLTPIRKGGGVGEWLWKGAKTTPVASLDVVLEHPKKGQLWLRYGLSFTEVGQRFELVNENVNQGIGNSPVSKICYRYQSGNNYLSMQEKRRMLADEDFDPTLSILSQRRDPAHYPEITYLAKMFEKIRLYREWSFGPHSPPRLPQKADSPNELLEPDCNNLGLVLNRLRRDPQVKQRLLQALNVLYEGIDDYDVQIEGGTVQVYFHEGRMTIPATRLSDGTLRYLCLLAILCHPNPPPLVCIEEPELGLHPDVLPTLAELIKEASERCQLIITTHSDVLVDAMTDCPEVVLVAEKSSEGTVLRRMDAEKLKPWLEKYRLGELWTRGEIGGVRW